MNNLSKIRASARNGSRRKEPTPADYNDEISEKTLETIRLVAASKDKKDERWETVHGPAW